MLSVPNKHPKLNFKKLSHFYEEQKNANARGYQKL